MKTIETILIVFLISFTVNGSGQTKVCIEEQLGNSTRIKFECAQRLNRNYIMHYGDAEPTSKLTRGVVFFFPDIAKLQMQIENIKNKIVKEKGIDFNPDNLCFATYFGRYDVNDGNDPEGNPYDGRLTILIQFLEKTESGFKAISGQIWDFGDARPPGNIEGEDPSAWDKPAKFRKALKALK